MCELALLAAALQLALLNPLNVADEGALLRQPPRRWHQGVEYRIEARLDEFSQVIVGALELAYTNNSPDTLRAIYLHLYLNAFRPNSIWARSERRPWLDFQSLEEPDFGFERLRWLEIDGRAVEPRYPHQPDSTVVELPLPRPLPPGGRLLLATEWEARLSTLARRQGRAGRHYDVAQWYPKIAVYDRGGWEAKPLYPQGEFYGEFATYDVTLEVLADQVIAATGLPIAGDPGWERARSARTERVTYGRNFYPRALRDGGADDGGGPGFLGARTPRGYKRVRWRAEQVHHFAWAADPAFRYEEGRYGDVIVRVLYRPEEERAWSGTGVGNAVKALAWLDSIFGPYPWPQVTVSRRIDGGGTEFPMLIMQSSASEGLTLHEMGHQYTYGVLANNEWKEGWLDEGFSTFQSRWYMERRYGPYGTTPAPHGYVGLAPRLTMREQAELDVLWLDLNGWSQPVSTVADEFGEFAIYNRMVYTKGSLVLEMLRYVMGEERFRALLRTFYARWKLQHVDEDAFRETAEEVCGCDLRWFFAQWLHATPLVDYAVGDIDVTGPASGEAGYVTSVEVVRKADGVMPVEVSVVDRAGREVRVRSSGESRRERVAVRTVGEPQEISIDPDRRTLDWNLANNRRSRRRFLLFRFFAGPTDEVIDWPFLSQRRRDEPVRAWLPLVWYNSADRLVLGVRSRENLMGWLAAQESGGAHGFDGDFDPYFWVRLRNPLWWRAPRRTHELAYWHFEGRSGLSARIEWDRSPHLQFAPERRFWLGIDLIDADAGRRHLPPGRWSPATTAELRLGYRESRARAGRQWSLRVEASAGGYRHDGRPAAGARSGGYARGTAELRWSATSGAGLFANVRIFGGGALGPESLPSQRRVFVSGAGPFQVIWNPLLRSRGALFRRSGVRYFAPGDGGLRAYRPELGGLWAVTGTARLGRRLEAGSIGRVELSVFADGGYVDGERVVGSGGPTALGLLSLGPGFRLSRHIARSSVSVAVDFPVYANRPELATDSEAERWGFRWSFTLGAGF